MTAPHQKHQETLGFHVPTSERLLSSTCSLAIISPFPDPERAILPKDVANELWFAADDLLTAGFLGSSLGPLL